MACIEDYPIIEDAIEFGVRSWGKREVMAIQIATFWIEGWLAAQTNISETDANIIRNGVKNYFFI